MFYYSASKLKISSNLLLLLLFFQRATAVATSEVSSLIDIIEQPTANSSASANVTTTARRPFRLVIYDPRTGQAATLLEYMRPAGNNMVDLTRLWQPCWCTYYACQCCLGLKMGEWLNNYFCFTANYNPTAMAIHLGVSLNERHNLSSNIAVNAPPTACVPLITPLPIYICLRIDSIRTVNGNVTMCTTLLFRFMQNELMRFFFGCLRFGGDGLFFNRLLEVLPGVGGNGLPENYAAGSSGLTYDSLT